MQEEEKLPAFCFSQHQNLFFDGFLHGSLLRFRKKVSQNVPVLQETPWFSKVRQRKTPVNLWKNLWRL